ncbi:MAG: Rne/Rng family ribonuclease [Paracoccaceae bacterium]
MAKKMLIDATHAEETRVVVVDGNKVEEFDFESENKRQLAGNIYLAKVTRVEPSLQAAFVDYGGNRHGFLAFSEIHPDYYQIPVADREALMEEERAYAEAQQAREEAEDNPRSSRSRSRSRSRSKAEKTAEKDAVTSAEADGAEISGMETIDLDDETVEGRSPMETVDETPVEEPDNGQDYDRNGQDEDKPFVAADHAAERDDSIESVADDDDHEELRQPRKPRPRKYKIQEVIKVRQIMLVQVVKEERGNKGAALTTYLSLAGRYCVLMPNTARGGGISRKITQAADRKKLKEIAASIEVPRGAGLIIRTAGAKRTKTEIKRDYEYLQRLWEQIRELTLKSIAPAKIYEEGDLIKRSIRDLYNRDIDEVFVEGERGYRIAKDFMKMIMPSHAKNVKHYSEPMPLFARYQVESYLSSMFNPTVQLKSGGYIVIGVTEALVAIDVNSGKATKEGSIEETALKTNLEAADEIARQLRLRDLAGLIVIDFIDMDERRNNAAVEKRIKDKLKTDRARIQVGRISGFGLMEMSRQRLRPGMIEATTQPCPHCHGTGLIRSDDNLALSILRQIEEEGVRRRSREVLVKCPVAIANYLMNQKREHVAQIEARYGLSVRIEGDPMLVSPDFTLEKFKTASRPVPEVAAPVISVDTSLMDSIDDETIEEEETSEAPVEAEDDKPKKRRRRRRRRKPSGTGEDNGSPQEAGTGTQEEPAEADATGSDAGVTETAETPEAALSDEAAAETQAQTEALAETPAEPVAEKPKSSRSRSRSRSRKTEEPATTEAETGPVAEVAEPAAVEPEEAATAEPKPKPKRTSTRKPSTRTRKPKAEPEQAPANAALSPEPEAEPARATAEAAELVTEERPEAAKPDEPAPAEAAVPAAAPEEASLPDATVEPEAEAASPSQAPAEPEPATTAEDADKPRKRGWWSLGG